MDTNTGNNNVKKREVRFNSIPEIRLSDTASSALSANHVSTISESLEFGIEFG